MVWWWRRVQSERMEKISPPKGELKVKIESISWIRKRKPTTGRAPCSGVSWKAMYDGTSILPPHMGWKDSATRKPTEASMATRPCLISASRRNLTRPSDWPCEKPSRGSFRHLVGGHLGQAFGQQVGVGR